MYKTYTVRIPCENEIASTTVNPVIANTSSTLAAAITNVGIPWSTPKPRFCKDNIDGTTTAGVTADKMNLKLKFLVFNDSIINF